MLKKTRNLEGKARHAEKSSTRPLKLNLRNFDSLSPCLACVLLLLFIECLVPIKETRPPPHNSLVLVEALKLCKHHLLPQALHIRVCSPTFSLPSPVLILFMFGVCSMICCTHMRKPTLFIVPLLMKEC